MLRKNTVKIKGPSGRKWKDVCISQDGRYGAPGENRKHRLKPTPEQIARQNHRNKVRKIWQLIRGNYQEGDRWVTVTYRKGERPDWETGLKQLTNFRKRVTYWFRKREIQIRMMNSIEHGSKGAIHMHMLLNDVEGINIDRILQRLWKFGQIHTSGLYENGDFHDLAEYMAKGGDDFEILTKGRDVESARPIDSDMVIDYVSKHSPIKVRPGRLIIHRK